MQDTHHLWEDGSHFSCCSVSVWNTSFLFLLYHRVAVGGNSAGHFSEEINTLHVAAQTLWAAFYATLACKARNLISLWSMMLHKDLHPALARTHPPSYMPPGKTTLKVLQLDCVLSHSSWSSSHGVLMQLLLQPFCSRRTPTATLSVGQLWGIFHCFATFWVVVLVFTKLHKVLQHCLQQWLLLAEFLFLACWKTLSPSDMLVNDNHNSGFMPCVKCSPDATVQERQLWAAHMLCSLRLFQGCSQCRLQRSCNSETVSSGWGPKARHGMW